MGAKSAELSWRKTDRCVEGRNAGLTRARHSNGLVIFSPSIPWSKSARERERWSGQASNRAWVWISLDAIVPSSAACDARQKGSEWLAVVAFSPSLSLSGRIPACEDRVACMVSSSIVPWYVRGCSTACFLVEVVPRISPPHSTLAGAAPAHVKSNDTAEDDSNQYSSTREISVGGGGRLLLQYCC